MNTTRGGCFDLFAKFLVLSLSCLYLAAKFISNLPKPLIAFVLK